MTYFFFQKHIFQNGKFRYSMTLKKRQQTLEIQGFLGKPKKIASGTRFRVIGAEISYGDVDTLNQSSGAGIIDQDGRTPAYIASLAADEKGNIFMEGDP